MENRLSFFNKALEISLTVFVFVAALQNQLITTASSLTFLFAAILFYDSFQKKTIVYRLINEHHTPIQVALLLVVTLLVLASSPALSVRNFIYLTLAASVLANLSKIVTYLYLKFYHRPATRNNSD